MHKKIGELLAERGVSLEDFFNALPENIEDLKGSAVILAEAGQLKVSIGEDASQSLEDLDSPE